MSELLHEGMQTCSDCRVSTAECKLMCYTVYVDIVDNSSVNLLPIPPVTQNFEELFG